MKILFIMPFKIHVNDWFNTGDSNQARLILNELTNYPDVKVDVVGNFENCTNHDDICSKYNINDFIDVGSVCKKRTYLKAGFEYLKSLDVLDKYDLINIHNSNPSIVSKINTYLPDNKVIFTLHAPPENMTFQFYHREDYLNFLNNPNKLLLCVSKSHAERCLTSLNYYKEFPEGNPNIAYILNGIPVDNIYNEDKVYDCGTIGRFSSSKNVLESLKCVASITRHTGGKGFIVGKLTNYESASDSAKKYSEDIVEVLNDNPQIEWFKCLTPNIIYKILNQSKTYLALSTIETFGLTICEALVQGTPCIGFDENGIGEIIEEGITGFKFSKKRSKWDDRYKEVIDLYEKCLDLDRENVRSRASERFNIKRVGSEYHKLYEDFIRKD